MYVHIVTVLYVCVHTCDQLMHSFDKPHAMNGHQPVLWLKDFLLVYACVHLCAVVYVCVEREGGEAEERGRQRKIKRVKVGKRL